jgi:trans-aconitate 2-methyltransferase
VRDLVAAIPNRDAKTLIDLGCGPGNSTEVLAAAFPDASVTGIDNSSDMIAAARKRLPSIRFALADIASWNDQGPFDVILSNAVFQWVEGHEVLFPRFVGRLRDGGSLAIQMPDNADVPAHRAMREIAAHGPWAAKLANVTRPARHDVLFYYDLLKPLCARVDIWRTTYHHVIAGGGAGVVEWFKGSALRPYLTVLDAAEQKAFLARYTADVEKAYPARADGTVLLPFPRLFFVATR